MEKVLNAQDFCHALFMKENPMVIKDNFENVYESWLENKFTDLGIDAGEEEAEIVLFNHLNK